MKNSFSNIVKIIAILICIVLIVWLIGYLITQNDYSANHQNNTKVEEDSNISMIAEELVTIFSYVNNTKESSNLACSTLGNDIGYSIASSSNFFDYYAPIILDCLYTKDYPTLLYNNSLSYKVIEDSEWSSYKDYFLNLSELTSLKEVYTFDIMSTYSEEEQSNIDYYLNANYKIAYPIFSNSAKNKITYNIERIFRESDKYVAKITATINNVKYIGNLKINVVDGHCQYETLIFY